MRREKLNLMKRILVTGGAGFIGSNLCRKLLFEGNEVICLDNYFTGSESNIIDLLDNKNFKFVYHDIIEPIYFDVDEIYNLACPASPVHYQSDPINTFKTSVLGAMNILELANKTKAKVLQASTSEVYGDPLVHPQVESYFGNVNPNGIRSCYDEGKRASETLFFDYYRQHNTKIKVVRIFNTYGPAMNKDDGRVVSNFIVQALQGKDITLYGEGKQTRSFCYVDDMILALVKMMNSSHDFLGPVNLGNPKEFHVIELAHMVLALTNSKSKIVHMRLPPDDPKVRKPDITLAKNNLCWEPQVDLQTGLLNTIDYFKNILYN